MPRIYSGHPIPALRPEQSDHVPWADCPQGLSSTSARCAHPPGKRLLLPILPAGLAMSRAMKLDSFHKLLERARARLFPPSKWAGLFPSAAYRRSAPAQLAGDILNPCRVGCFSVACVFFARQKAGGKSNPRWPFQRAMRPVAEWRPFLSNEQKTTSDPRAARLVAERR